MEIIRLTDDNVSEVAKKAAKALAAGGIIAYPTDTVYGLGVDAGNQEALERLRTLKGRELKRPMSVIVRDVKHLKDCGEVNEAAKILASKFLPGPLTLVLPAKKHLPEHIVFQGGIGVRIPDDPFCLELAHAFGKPYTSTSANRTGMATPKEVQEILWHFGPLIEHIALIVDGGVRDSANPSTVVSCLTEPPRVLREGVLSRADLGL